MAFETGNGRIEAEATVRMYVCQRNHALLGNSGYAGGDNEVDQDPNALEDKDTEYELEERSSERRNM